METELTNILDELSLEEVDQLLDRDIHFAVDTKIVSRIKSSVFRKAGMKKNQLWKFYSKNVMAASLVLGILMLTGLVKGYHYYQTPAAYLDVDINPSIELGINRWDRIVSAKGYNSEGENILEITRILNQKVKIGVRNIVEVADEQGFFAKEEGGAVALTSIADDNEVAEKLADSSKEAIEQYISEQEINVEVITEYVALERRIEAKEIGITAGKLNLIQKLQALDDKAMIEEYKHTSVKEIMKSIKELKKNKKVSIKTDKQIEKEKQEKENDQITTDNQYKNDIDYSSQMDDKIKEDDKQNNKQDKIQTKIQDIKEDGKKDIKINEKQNDKTNDKINQKQDVKISENQGTKINEKQNNNVNDKQDSDVNDKQDSDVNDKQDSDVNNKQDSDVNDKQNNNVNDKQDNNINDKQDNNIDDDQDNKKRDIEITKDNSEKTKK